MRTADRSGHRTVVTVLCLTALIVSLSACGSSGSSSQTSASTAASARSATGTNTSGASASTGTSRCGPRPGEAATGPPIRLGAIATRQPGTDFTDVPGTVAAYFACVNANGGVNGHPVKLYIQTDQTQPAQVAAAANLLVGTDHVLGIVGVTDLLECTIDKAGWQKLGMFVINAGISPDCWASPNYAAVNMGPRYSSDGAVQYALAQHANKIVFDQANVPGAAYGAAGPTAVAAAAHVPIKSETDNVPINDANSVALRLVNEAGSNGAVVLDFTPPEALVILQAAQKLGLEDRVKLWGCSTPCNTDFLAKALGPKWNHKLFVNAEMASPDDHGGPEFALYRAILERYGSAVQGGVGSFSQFGFVIGEFTVKALQTIKGPYTVKSVNQAFERIKGYTSEMLCQPWSFGNLPLHIPNNVDYTTTPENGQMVTAQRCTAITSADPQIALYRRLAKARGLG